MKIVLHMGTPKTGSTSLQVGLGKIRHRLLAEGFYYPESPEKHGKYFHHLMLAFFENPKHLKPQQLARFGTIDKMISTAQRFLTDAKKYAEKTGCHTIILSSELLFPNGEKDPHKLNAQLAEISLDIEPVVYVREPAGLYKSELQQYAKVCEFRKPASQTSLRFGLELIEKVFERKPTVRAFDREQLTGGDILQDFCCEVLGLQHIEPELARLSRNSSLSAEATRALLDYGKILDEFGLGAYEYHSKFVRTEIIRFVDQGNLLTELSLKPDLANTIRKSADEYVWLRDKFRIEFRELDYKAINPAARQELARYGKPEEIFEFDQDKLNWLLLSVLHNLNVPAKRDLRSKAEKGPKFGRLIKKIERILGRSN